MANETRELASFAATLTHDHIPGHVRRLAVDLLIDQIGCEFGGCELPWARQVRDTYRKAGGTPEATVVRYGDRLPAMSAALINSTFGHSFEYDDINPVIHGHPGPELVPPLLAISEREHVPGREFLTTLIAAYEVRGRIGWAVSPEMCESGGPQFSTTCGPFGVAAGVGRLLGFDSEKIHNALGIAGTFSGGLMQYDHGGGSVKRLFTGVGASSGIQAAELARAGMTGPEGILEGARGLLNLYVPVYRPQRLVADFGTRWTLEQALFKPYCCCGIIHPAIDALRRIVDAHGISADDIESIEVGNPTGFHDHAAVTAPHDLLGMQFSTSYSLALTLLKCGNTPREYTEQALRDPAIKAFAAKVRVHEAPGLNERCEGHYAAHVKVHTKSGALYEELVMDAKGSPGAPMSGAEIDEKFRSQAGGALGTARCAALLQTLRNVETLDDMAKLAAMLVV